MMVAFAPVPAAAATTTPDDDVVVVSSELHQPPPEVNSEAIAGTPADALLPPHEEPADSETPYEVVVGDSPADPAGGPANVTVEIAGGDNEQEQAKAPAKPRIVNVNCKRRELRSGAVEGSQGSTDIRNETWSTAPAELAPSLKTGEVVVMNSSDFLKMWMDRHDPKVGPNRTVEAECWLVMFYADWCPFSTAAAPAFNGLARAFPDVPMMAVDSGYIVNTQFGVVALPTFALFHNAKVASKLVQSTSTSTESLSSSLTGEMTGARLGEFLFRLTGLKNATELVVLDQDRLGPLPSQPNISTDYYLYCSWLFILACAVLHFGKSCFCQRVVEYLRNNWQEAEIQHEHID